MILEPILVLYNSTQNTRKTSNNDQEGGHVDLNTQGGKRSLDLLQHMVEQVITPGGGGKLENEEVTF